MITRRFEFVAGSSAKFWEATFPMVGATDPHYWTARWGRLGADGQYKQFDLGEAHRARLAAGDKCVEKRNKGYTEVAIENAVVVPHATFQKFAGALRLCVRMGPPPGAQGGTRDLYADRPWLGGWPLRENREIAVNLPSCAFAWMPHMSVANAHEGVYSVMQKGQADHYVLAIVRPVVVTESWPKGAAPVNAMQTPQAVLETRKCKRCGTPFGVQSTSNEKYCSVACWSKAFSADSAAEAVNGHKSASGSPAPHEVQAPSFDEPRRLIRRRK